jgi:hypothetical protein
MTTNSKSLSVTTFKTSTYHIQKVHQMTHGGTLCWAFMFFFCCSSSDLWLNEVSSAFPKGWDLGYVEALSRNFAVSIEFVTKLGEACKQAPVNSLTGNKFLILVPLDKTFAPTFKSGICSWNNGRLLNSSVIYICFDKASFHQAQQFPVNCIFFEMFSEEMQMKGLYRHVFASLVTRAGIECFIVAGNMILFDDFMDIWRWECDMEFALDNIDGFDLKLMKVSTGSTDLIRYMPVPVVLRFFDRILESAQMKPCPNDCDLIWRFLGSTSYRSAPLRWTSLVDLDNITYTFVEPWRVPSIGLVLCGKRQQLCAFVKYHYIKQPIGVRFNRMVSWAAELSVLRALDLNIMDKCKNMTWPWWQKSCSYPTGIDCKNLFK